MAYSEPQTPVTRIVGIAFVVLLHIALIYALATGLAYRAIEIVRAPIETRIISEAKPPPLEAPPPPPQLAPPPAAFVPPPEVHIATLPPPPPKVHIATPPPPPTKSTAITTVTPTKPVTPPVRVVPQLDMAHSQQPEYPAASRRLGEQGVTVIEVLVGVDGQALEAKVVQSSGYDRLDQTAIAAAKANYFRIAPGTVDGKPQPMWLTFKVNWKLE